MTAFVFAYMTAPDRKTADRIAQTLVKEKLASCVNIVPGMVSTYRWRGNIESADEIIVIAKTRATRMPSVVKAVREVHPDETPCVVALPLASGVGNQDFLTWLEAETAPPAGGAGDP